MSLYCDSQTREFFEERAKRADVEAFDEFFLNRMGGEPPRKGDEMPV